MRLGEAIERIKEKKPNIVPNNELIREISNLDGMLFAETISRYHPLPRGRFCGYGEDTPADTVLLAAPPYGDDVYMYWLEYRIDLYNGETSKAAVSVELYNAAVKAWQAWYNRTHVHVDPPRFRY